MTRKAKTNRRKMPGIAKAFFLGAAQQKYQDTKRKLYDDLDYDRISRTTYERKLNEAYEEYQESIRFANEE